MKYTCRIEIQVPIKDVVALWQDEYYFSKWQDGFESITHLSGTPNTKGATARLIFNGKQRMELKETIIVNNLPNEKKALYVHKHMTNTQTTRFNKINEVTTQYISEVEYMQFNGLFIKLMARLLPNMFKKQSEKWMLQFKTFAESHFLST